MIIAGVAVLAGAVLVIRAIAGDENGRSDREQAIREVERKTSGAYDCMPPGVQRRFDAALRRYDARFGEVIDSLPDDTSPEEANRRLLADPQVTRLRARARRLLVGYAPGGDKFDPACYSSATKRYDRKIAKPPGS
jgi:hypothetical protein